MKSDDNQDEGKDHKDEGHEGEDNPLNAPDSLAERMLKAMAITAPAIVHGIRDGTDTLAETLLGDRAAGVERVTHAILGGIGAGAEAFEIHQVIRINHQEIQLRVARGVHPTIGAYEAYWFLTLSYITNWVRPVFEAFFHYGFAPLGIPRLTGWGEASVDSAINASALGIIEFLRMFVYGVAYLFYAGANVVNPILHWHDPEGFPIIEANPNAQLPEDPSIVALKHAGAEIQHAGEVVVHGLEDAAEDLKEVLEDAAEDLKEVLEDAGEKMKAGAKKAGDDIEHVGEVIEDELKAAGEKMKEAAKKTGDDIEHIGEVIDEALEDAGEKMKAAVKKAGDDIDHVVDKVEEELHQLNEAIALSLLPQSTVHGHEHHNILPDGVRHTLGLDHHDHEESKKQEQKDAPKQKVKHKHVIPESVRKAWGWDKHDKEDDNDTTVLSVTVPYNQGLQDIFKNLHLNMDEQKKLDQMAFELDPLKGFSFHPVMFTAASSNELPIIVIPKEIIDFGYEKFMNLYGKLCDFYYGTHSNEQ